MNGENRSKIHADARTGEISQNYTRSLESAHHTCGGRNTYIVLLAPSCGLHVLSCVVPVWMIVEKII